MVNAKQATLTAPSSALPSTFAIAFMMTESPCSSSGSLRSVWPRLHIGLVPASTVNVMRHAVLRVRIEHRHARASLRCGLEGHDSHGGDAPANRNAVDDPGNSLRD